MVGYDAACKHNDIPAKNNQFKILTFSRFIDIAITLSSSPGWNRIKAKLVALKDVVVGVVKKAVAAMWPKIKQKLLEVVQILLNTAKQAIVNIAGEIFLVNVPSSLR